MALQRTYIAYLAGLNILLFAGLASHAEAPGGDITTRASRLGLLAVGGVAGFSSKPLGIGGGLAITVGLSAGLKVPQHRAQLISLVVSLIPTTVPPPTSIDSKGD